MADEAKQEKAAKPKFKLGDMVTHPLGMRCLVVNVFDARKDETTGENVPLGVYVYQLNFLDKNGCIQATNVVEAFLEVV